MSKREKTKNWNFFGSFLEPKRGENGASENVVSGSSKEVLRPGMGTYERRIWSQKKSVAFLQRSADSQISAQTGREIKQKQVTESDLFCGIKRDVKVRNGPFVLPVIGKIRRNRYSRGRLWRLLRPCRFRVRPRA